MGKVNDPAALYVLHTDPAPSATIILLALGVPANERMDTLVEKACELGVAAIQPLMCERSVLRLAGDRADKKVQSMTDEFVKQVDTQADQKEQEILQV